MPHIRVAEAAEVLGVSDDTIRRWVTQQRLETTTDNQGRMVIDSAQLARFSASRFKEQSAEYGILSSARNRITGLVTAVHRDRVVSQVDLQCGPFRVVSVMSTEAVDELGLEPGSIATASMKATTVIIETQGHRI